MWYRAQKITTTRKPSKFSVYMYRFFLAIMSLALSAYFFTQILALSGLLGLDERLLIRGIVMAALSFLFFFSFISVINSSWMIQEYHLLKPLVALPISVAALRNSILASALVDCLWIAIVPVTSGVALAIRFASFLPLVIVLLYALSTILLSLALGFHVGSIIGSRKYGGRGLVAKIMRALQFILVLVAFLSFRIVYQVRDIIQAFLGPLGALTEPLWFIYPFSAAEGTMTSIELHGLEAAGGFLLALLYPILFYATYVKGFKKFWQSLAYPAFIALGKPTFVGRLNAPPKALLTPIAGILFKDLKLATREPRVIYMAVFPLFELLYFVYMIYRSQGAGSYGPMVPFFFMFSALYAPWAAYMFLRGEGVGASVLLSNPVSKRDLAVGKSLAPTVIMAAYMIPIGTAVAWKIGIEQLIGLTTALLSGFSSSTFAMRVLADHVLKTGDVAAIPSKTQIKVLFSCVIFIGAPFATGLFSYGISGGNLVMAMLLSLLSSELLFVLTLVSLLVFS